jgi:hypothetical protein
MHPTISYQLAQARIAALHRRTRRHGLARAAAHTPSCAPRRTTRTLRFWSGNRRRAWQATTTAM